MCIPIHGRLVHYSIPFPSINSVINVLTLKTPKRKSALQTPGWCTLLSRETCFWRHKTANPVKAGHLHMLIAWCKFMV